MLHCGVASSNEKEIVFVNNMLDLLFCEVNMIRYLYSYTSLFIKLIPCIAIRLSSCCGRGGTT